jgi:hypothetical protein
VNFETSLAVADREAVFEVWQLRDVSRLVRAGGRMWNWGDGKQTDVRRRKPAKDGSRPPSDPQDTDSPRRNGIRNATASRCGHLCPSANKLALTAGANKLDNGQTNEYPRAVTPYNRSNITPITCSAAKPN